MDNRVPEEIVAAIVRLLGDVAASHADLNERKRQLMRGLARLVNADGWACSVTMIDRAKGASSIGLVHEGLSDEQVAGMIEGSLTTPRPPEDDKLFDLCALGDHFTRSREQLVTDEEWYNHPTVRKYRIERGIDDTLFSIQPFIEHRAVSGIFMYRRTGNPRFTALQRRIVHIVMSNVSWLHTASIPGASSRGVPKLSQRLRGVLTLLISGYNRNDIARMLELSPHTVKDHIKAIYRHFDVKSHPQLMRRFQFGDGRDVAAASTVAGQRPRDDGKARRRKTRALIDVQPEPDNRSPDDSGKFAAVGK